jgi:hypothetical protein
LADVVSNYPRSEEPAVMTPELAKSVLVLASFFQGWMILPQLAWGAFLFFTISKIYSTEWVSYGSQACMVLGLVFGAGGLVALHVYARRMMLAKLRLVASYWLWLSGYLPLVGPLGPIILQHLLCKDLQRYGIPASFNILNRDALQKIIDGEVPGATPLG